jgi:hypothetical protein
VLSGKKHKPARDASVFARLVQIFLNRRAKVSERLFAPYVQSERLLATACCARVHITAAALILRCVYCGASTTAAGSTPTTGSPSSPYTHAHLLFTATWATFSFFSFFNCDYNNYNFTSA